MSYRLTHPVIASLDHPLFACGGKRVKQLNLKAIPLALPLTNEKSKVLACKSKSDFGLRRTPGGRIGRFRCVEEIPQLLLN
jgi:hypothetical protein